MITKNIKHHVLDLKESDKIHLIDFIFDTIDSRDIEINTNWVMESEKRFDAFKAGKLKSYSYEQVMKMVEK